MESPARTKISKETGMRLLFHGNSFEGAEPERNNGWTLGEMLGAVCAVMLVAAALVLGLWLS